MSNSLLIRTAVKLCLIAAMLIQPMALVAAQGTCVQGPRAGDCCQANAVSHACRCCELKTDGDLRGCCRGSDDTAGHCTMPAADSQESDQPALSSCMCGMRSEPLPPLPQPIPVPQSRDLVVIDYLDHVAMDAELSCRPDRAASCLPIGKLSPHFSQRYLCIWRI